MRRGRILLLLALIVIVGVGLVYIVLRQGGGTPQVGVPPAVQGEPTIAPTLIPTVKVVVVTQRVERGETITEDKLDTVDYQADLVLPIMFTDIGQVTGLVARFNLDPYTVLNSALVTDLNDTAQGSDDALFIEPGMVAVSIPVDRLSSISYAPQRGDHVNVIVTLLMVDLDSEWQSILPNWTGNVIAPGGGGLAEGQGASNAEDIRTIVAQPFRGTSEFGRPVEDLLLEQMFYQLPSEGQRPRLVSQTLIQNVIVLQLGNFATPGERAYQESLLEPTATPDPAQGEQLQAEPTPVVIPPPPDVITLIVAPQDAVTLNYLIYSGAQLTLAMRNPRDTSTVETEAVTLAFLLDEYNIPVPVKLPYGLHPAVQDLLPPSLPNDVPTPTPGG